ncbi:MAG: glycosyltransferase family 4 protein [Gemmatimonadota bacterium]
MRVALVHYWLVRMRGGERVLESLCEIFPEADIFTHVYDPEAVSETIRRHRVRTTFIGRLPNAVRRYRKYLPLMPLALEQLDLRAYDLVISSESGPAKGVITSPGSLHVCYCHSTMRYVWDMYPDYLAGASALTRWLMRPIIHYLRMWDVTAAARVDHFICNSEHVSRRVRKYYRREAEVIPPPVDTESFTTSAETDDNFLFLSELVRYKRPDLAVEAFNRLGKPLVVIGEGEELAGLRRLAGPTVRLLGRQPFAAIRDHYARCRALIFPGEEDFGIVPVEAMAAGRPVIAFGRGGARETVVDGVTGLFFDEQTPEALCEAVRRFEAEEGRFSSERIREHARGFDRAVFKERMRASIERLLESRPGAAVARRSFGRVAAGGAQGMEPVSGLPVSGGRREPSGAESSDRSPATSS